MKLGVVANEFFEPALGRMGGFGWAAAKVARCFGDDPTLGVDVVFFTGNVASPDRITTDAVVHGSRLLFRTTKPYGDRVRQEAPDLLLLIDYRPNYRGIVAGVRAPVILWVRDPRTPDDVARIRTLEIPDRPGARPEGIEGIDCTSFRSIYRRARWRLRPVLVATTTPSLKPKVSRTYGIEPKRIHDLPNIVETTVMPIRKSPAPRVVFLGRADPIKRPWVFVEVARRLPQVEFLILGSSYVTGDGTWQPTDLPANVRLLGHLDGKSKTDLLASAWVLLNTSIHESLAVSFLEALATETPIVSCQDPESVVSRFGAYVGRLDGSGIDGVPRFVDSVDGLLRDPARRQQLGREGRLWVTRTHTRTAFLEAFAELGPLARVPLPFGGPPAS